MFFWFREIIGWALVALAVILLRTGINYTANRQVVEAGVVAILAIGTLRAGILLIRMSTAARIALRHSSADS